MCWDGKGFWHVAQWNGKTTSFFALDETDERKSSREAARAKVNNDSPRGLDLEYQARKGRLIVEVKALRPRADLPKSRQCTEPGSKRPQARQQRNNQVTLPQLQEWNPSHMKTG